MHIFMNRQLKIFDTKNKGGNSCRLSFQPRIGRVALVIAMSIFLGACASKQVVSDRTVNDFNAPKAELRNEKISQNAVASKLNRSDAFYRLGPDDLLELTVFRVDDLNRKVRVDGGGQIELPLLGPVIVGAVSYTHLTLPTTPYV